MKGKENSETQYGLRHLVEFYLKLYDWATLRWLGVNSAWVTHRNQNPSSVPALYI